MKQDNRRFWAPQTEMHLSLFDKAAKLFCFTSVVFFFILLGASQNSLVFGAPHEDCASVLHDCKGLVRCSTALDALEFQCKNMYSAVTCEGSCRLKCTDGCRLKCTKDCRGAYVKLMHIEKKDCLNITQCDCQNDRLCKEKHWYFRECHTSARLVNFPNEVSSAYSQECHVDSKTSAGLDSSTGSSPIRMTCWVWIWGLAILGGWW